MEKGPPGRGAEATGAAAAGASSRGAFVWWVWGGRARVVAVGLEACVHACMHGNGAWTPGREGIDQSAQAHRQRHHPIRCVRARESAVQRGGTARPIRPRGGSRGCPENGIDAVMRAPNASPSAPSTPLTASAMSLTLYCGGGRGGARAEMRVSACLCGGEQPCGGSGRSGRHTAAQHTSAPTATIW